MVMESEFSIFLALNQAVPYASYKPSLRGRKVGDDLNITTSRALGGGTTLCPRL